MSKKVQEIVIVLSLAMCAQFFTLSTTGGEKLLYKTLPEETIFIFEEFDKKAITEKESGGIGIILEILEKMPTAIQGEKQFSNYLKLVEEVMKKTVGLQCKQAFAIFYDERSSTYLKITIPMFGGGMNALNAPTINIPIGFITTSTCDEGNQWNELKESNYTLQKKTVEFLKEYLKTLNIQTKIKAKKYSKVYSKTKISFEITEPPPSVKFSLKLYTYIIGNTIISSSSKLDIKRFIKGVEGTLYNSPVFKNERELLSANNPTTFWWFNFQRLYIGLKNIALQFVPPMALAPFFQFEAASGLNKLSSFSGFKDKNNIWKERINFTQESDFINKVFGQSGYDKDFICSDIDIKNTYGFISINLTKDGVLALWDKVKTLLSFTEGRKDEDVNAFVNGFTKLLQNDTFSGNLCLTAYNKQENNENKYKLVVFYKAKDFSQKICEELMRESKKKECEIGKTYNANTQDELLVWDENERDSRVIFSKAKNAILFLFPMKGELPEGNTDTIYKEILDSIVGKEKNSFNTTVGLNFNLKSIINAVKKELEARPRQNFLPLKAELLEFYKRYLDENIYVKVSGGKDYIEMENNLGGVLIGLGLVGVGGAIVIPAIARHW